MYLPLGPFLVVLFHQVVTVQLCVIVDKLSLTVTDSRLQYWGRFGKTDHVQ